MEERKILSLLKQFAYRLCDLISNRVSSIINNFDFYSKTSPFTKIYGLARASLAISLLVTLIFNEIETLYPEHLFNPPGMNMFFEKVNLFFMFDYNHLWIPKLISISVLMIVILGYLPQITGVLHWWISFSFFNSAIIIDGGDQINAIITLILIPITLLDNRSNHWQKTKSNTSFKNMIGWGFFFLIEIQCAFLYLQAGIEKPYKVSEWRDGTAIYYWLNNNIFGSNSTILNFINPIITNDYFAFIITWSIILLEISLFGAFYMLPKNRTTLFYIAIIFHFFILVFHGLGSFFFSISGILLIYLLNRNYAFKYFQQSEQCDHS